MSHLFRSHVFMRVVAPALVLIFAAAPAEALGVPCTSFDEGSDYPLEYQETLNLAIESLDRGRTEPEKDDRKCFLRMAEALTRHLVVEDPADPEARYWYAAAMGLRAAEEGGRTQVALAKNAHEQALITLTIEPNHAGAQHVLGRIHAGVMRLSSFKRWVATKMLGGKALSGASWETAESFLAEAARLQPELATHHYELGALYLDTDRPELALAAFQRTLTCPPVHTSDREVQALAQGIVERLTSGEPEERRAQRAESPTSSRRGVRRLGIRR